MVSGAYSPTLRLDIKEPKGYGVASGPKCEFLGTGSPFGDDDGQLDINIDKHPLPLTIRNLLPGKDTSIMAGSNNFIISWPVYITDRLGVILHLLQHSPWIDVCQFIYLVYTSCMVFFCCYCTIVSFGGKTHSTYMVLLKEQDVWLGLFHYLDFLSIKYLSIFISSRRNSESLLHFLPLLNEFWSGWMVF